MQRKLLRVEGHRGYPSKVHENTLEGFSVSMEEGLPGIELDIWLTADNVVVVAHGCNRFGLDKLWDPVTQRFVYVHLPRSTYNELSELRAVDKKSKLCTLEDVIDLVGNRDDFYINIEVKHNSERLVEEALKLIKRKNENIKFEFCTFNHKLKLTVAYWCEQLHMPNIKFTYNINVPNLVTNQEFINQIISVGDNISLDILFVLSESDEVLNLIKVIKQNGGVVKCYNYMALTDIECGDFYEQLMRMNIDVFICNAPERLIEYNNYLISSGIGY